MAGFVLEAAAKAGANPNSNLPALLTPLVGREQEAAAVCGFLQRAEVRLVTLTGAGGIGKTRLSLEVATRLLDAFADGVCFVQLAPLSDHKLVLPTIAQTLGIKETGAASILDLLKTTLRERHLLLLLDNFEQVLAAAAQLVDVLAGCPHVKVLVTSRALLHVHGEHEFQVPPLALPTLTQQGAPETLAQYAAVALFLERARDIKPAFALTQTNADAIVRICRHLDGLPLAIELAAARMKLFPPEALLQRLAHRLTILTSGAQDAPPRQQTLRKTLAWSYDLLHAEEQRLFRRLSVFIDGCCMEAIEAVSRAVDGGTVQVVDEVASLMDNSLLQVREQESGESRLLMLETIREYGLECLSTSGERATTQQAHAAYFLMLAEKAEPELVGPQQVAWFARLEQEYANLRAALEWLLEQGEPRPPVEMALRLGSALYWFWRAHGHINEGRNFLERALEVSEGCTTLMRAKALMAAAGLAFAQSDYERTEILSQESLALSRNLGDQEGSARALYYLGFVAWERGQTEASRSLLADSVALARTTGSQERIAWALFLLALIESSQGKYTRARALLEESLALHRKRGDKRGIAHTLPQLAQVLLVSLGDPSLIRSLLDECLAISKEVGFKEGIAAALSYAGQLALTQGSVDMSREQIEESVRVYKELGHRHGTAEALCALGRVATVQGDYETARARYEESLEIAREIDDKPFLASGLEGLAGLVGVQGERVWAAQLWGAAEALRAVIGVPLPPAERAAYEQAVVTARHRLGERLFARAWAKGRTMSVEQVLSSQGHEAELKQPQVVIPSPTYPADLTAREVEVLRLVAKGLTNLQIAQELRLSEKTVANHLTHIFNKTTSDNRAAATAFAIHHGLA